MSSVITRGEEAAAAVLGSCGTAPEAAARGDVWTGPSPSPRSCSRPYPWAQKAPGQRRGSACPSEPARAGHMRAAFPLSWRLPAECLSWERAAVLPS